jgi:hypothetical protein
MANHWRVTLKGETDRRVSYYFLATQNRSYEREFRRPALALPKHYRTLTLRL